METFFKNHFIRNYSIKCTHTVTDNYNASSYTNIVYFLQIGNSILDWTNLTYIYMYIDY